MVTHRVGCPGLDVYDPQANTWTSLTDAPRARDHFQASIIGGKIYLAGGRRTNEMGGTPFAPLVPETDVYNIATGTWTTLAQDIPTPRAGCTSVRMHDYVVVLGGETLGQTLAHNEVEALEVATGNWHSLPSLNIGRHGMQAIAYNDAIYVCAGSVNKGGGPETSEQEVLHFCKSQGVSAFISITAPSNGATFIEPADILVTAQVLVPVGNTITDVDFFANGNYLGTDTTFPYSFNWQNVAAGAYTLTAVVNTAMGSASSQPINITVSPAGGFSVQITEPANGSVYTEPANVPITAVVTTSGSVSIDKVEFFADGNYLGEDATEPYSFDWQNVAAGAYVLTAVATSTTNDTEVSPPVNITVNPSGGNVTVNITSPPDGSVYGTPANISVDAQVLQTGGGGDTYIQVSNPSLGWRRGRIGYNPASIWTPKQDVIAGGNTSFKFVVKDFLGNAEWNKIELLMQGSGSPVLLSDHIGSAIPLSDGWLQMNIPLTLFGSVDLTQVAFVELFTKGAAYFEIGILEMIFEGGSTPFEWFGPNKNDNSFNTDLQFDLMTGGGSVAVDMVEFFANGNLIGSDNNVPFSIDWNNVAPGIYNLTATAHLTGGGSVSSGSVQVSVSDVDVGLTAPANGTAYELGEEVNIEAVATSSTSITQVEFFANGISLGTDADAPYSLVWTPALPGNYVLTAMAMDAYNGIANSAPVNINVNEPPVSNINITSPTEGQNFPGPSNILITVDAGGSVEPIHINVSNPLLGWRRGRIGYNPISIWSPKYDVIAGGNTTLQFTVKDFSGTTEWNKLELLMQGSGSPVLLSNYIGSAIPLGDDWLQMNIPLSAFGSVDLTQVAFVEIFTKGAAFFEIGISDIVFTGGSTPFEWFGLNKNDNSFNIELEFEVVSGGGGGPMASLVEFYANGSYLGVDADLPFEFLWEGVTDGFYELTAVGTFPTGQETSPPINITVGLDDLRVVSVTLLEGNMEDSGLNMRTELRDQNVLPLLQPFNMAPWNYDGTEGFTEYVDVPSNVVDWVLVELYSPDGLNLIERQAALLLMDGTITSALDPPLNHVAFDGVEDSNAYRLVIRSRNHLPVMSATELLPDGGQINMDFSADQNAAYGNYMLKPVGNGKFMFIAGDANGDGSITVHDLNLLKGHMGTTGYSNCDANCDGSITNEDFFLLLKNSGNVAPEILRY